MKILKYIFLLLLLSLITVTVFLATQKGDFTIERSRIIKAPKTALFNYINDYRNWEDFSSWMIDNSANTVNYGEISSGKNAYVSWVNNENQGDIKTISTKNTDEIQQKLNYDGTLIDSQITFKDTIGGTKVTWETKGEMSFYHKVYTSLNGGADKIIGTVYEKTLLNLDKILDFETNTYAIKVNGVVKKSESFYIKQTFTSEIQKITKNARIVIPKLVEFCSNNGIAANGKPFIIYHTYDTSKNLAKISICLPINKEIFTSSGSDILTGKLEAFEAVKTTLTGDYSHREEAIAKTIQFVNNEKLILNPSWSHLEILTSSKQDIKSPSKWVTELYYPLKPKPVAVARPVYQPRAEPVEVAPAPKHEEPEQETSEF
ncbi:SRPBCC family protein [Flavobacterium agrisoli]|uniref:Transcriptional regulator n=1 Tax=Flavobacterium agrisoli TaxID=2793066 RepID=A0A934PLC0_9FLAO|nr:transcriptional regulator [Flavobacterium agrisoli]MBK0368944.1 transcriptional regulator [Flavobacterium agrisoli]